MPKTFEDVLAEFNRTDFERQYAVSVGALMGNLHQGYRDIQEMELPLFFELLKLLEEQDLKNKRRH